MSVVFARVLSVVRRDAQTLALAGSVLAPGEPAPVGPCDGGRVRELSDVLRDCQVDGMCIELGDGEAARGIVRSSSVRWLATGPSGDDQRGPRWIVIESGDGVYARWCVGKADRGRMPRDARP